ncbi:hypothetical protein PENSPDRAFT_281643 [Peniophora sp. CONT]|nr:hypothetical protein PENSPDRAFT_281643 [Peniophora sp. CONT]
MTPFQCSIRRGEPPSSSHSTFLQRPQAPCNKRTSKCGRGPCVCGIFRAFLPPFKISSILWVVRNCTRPPSFVRRGLTEGVERRALRKLKTLTDAASLNGYTPYPNNVLSQPRHPRSPIHLMQSFVVGRTAPWTDGLNGLIRGRRKRVQCDHATIHSQQCIGQVTSRH